LSSAQALVALKGIDEQLALRLISAAQDIVNKRGLYESKIIAPGGSVRQISAAFDERWLSGEIEPPEMSIRIRRNFEEARREYRAANPDVYTGSRKDLAVAPEEQQSRIVSDYQVTKKATS